jgi:cytidylate kinase
MIITISGTPGSGKTTAANVIAERLKLAHYYMGGIRRKVAKDRGMTIDEFNKLGEKDPSTDKLVDDYLINLGRTEDNFIAEGRTAAHFIPNSIKIFMDVDLKVGAERILKDLTEKGNAGVRNESAAASIDEQARLLKHRLESDRRRYMKYYSFDFLDKKLYDLWLDTSHLTPEQVIEQIVSFVKKKG